MFAGKCLIMIRTALTGSERFLRHYSEIIRSHSEFTLTAVHCNEYQPGIHFNYSSCGSCNQTYDQLFEKSDALIVTDKAGDKMELISRFLKNSRHVLILPDITLSAYQLKKLTKIADEAGVILNLHYNTLSSEIKERIKEYIQRPEYIFMKLQVTDLQNDRNKTIFDVLYRYIYLVFELNPVNPVKYHVTGVPVCSSEPRILDVNILFENGASAHINISSCYKEEYEKLEIFGHNRMVSMEPTKKEFLMIQSHPDDIIKNSINDIHPACEEDVLMKPMLTASVSAAAAKRILRVKWSCPRAFYPTRTHRL